MKNYRGVETHFLSAQEIITAAAYQNQFPNTCHLTEVSTYIFFVLFVFIVETCNFLEKNNNSRVMFPLRAGMLYEGRL